MGVPGPGSLSQVVNAAMAQQERFASMRAFFEGTGSDETAGIWERSPVGKTATLAGEAA